MYMSKEVFKIIYTLSQDQPWLNEKIEVLTHLLSTECKNQIQHDLILELISRFKYLTHKDFATELMNLAESIVTDDIDAKNTQILAMTADSKPDSGQFVIYGLKPIFQQLGWADFLAITNFQKSFKYFKNNGKQHTNIVLVDEFIGSGTTVLSRVNRLKRLYLENGFKNIIIKVKVLVANSFAIKMLRKQGIDVEAMILINRGISDYYKDSELINALNAMDALENDLLPKYKEIDLPKLGFGQAESLYARDGGNTPNSVFPVFWWPFYKDTTIRETLTIRAMD